MDKYISELLREAYGKTGYAALHTPDPTFWTVCIIDIPNVDYTFNGMLGLKNKLEKFGHKINIDNLAQEILKNYDTSSTIPHIDSKPTNNVIVRYSLNFKIKKEWLAAQILSIYKQPNIIVKTKKPRNILVDFSSPNIAKDLHVGHLRSTIIGDSICRLYEELGHNVSRINHVGDFGLQFGMIIQYLLNSGTTVTTLDSVKDFKEIYTLAKKIYDADKVFQEEAHKRVVELQTGKVEIVEMWKKICAISKQHYEEVYKKLDIRLTEVGESFYSDKIKAVVEELANYKMLTDDKGRKIVKGKYTNPLTVVKSDGGFTYDTTDIAAIKYRLIDLDVDDIIYVVDSGQRNHFDQIFDLAKNMNWLVGDKTVSHIDFGLVLGEDGKRIRTRDGNTAKLVDMLENGIVETNKVVVGLRPDLSKEKTDEITKNLAYGSIKYMDLSNTRTHNYSFSFSKMLDLKGNSAVYLLYAYARVSNIIKNAEGVIGSEFKLPDAFDDLKLETEVETALSKQLIRFNEVIITLAKTLFPHHLCKYMYDLACKTNQFYEKCKCVDGGKINHSRIVLCHAIKKTMEKGFYILGINPLVTL